jgi:hypothetical protein
MVKKKPLRPLIKLKKDVWKIFSIWVRKGNADWRGYVQCFTCPAILMWNSGEIHAGHFIHDKQDFNEMNVHPQCQQCNYWKKGNTRIYALRMVEKYGLEKVKELEKLAQEKGNRYNRIELIEIMEKYGTLNKT